MHFLLMNKNVAVANIYIDPLFSTAVLEEIYEKEYLPLHIQTQPDKADAYFEHWFMHRCIPKGREGLSEFMALTKFANPFEMALRNRMLSLTDQYWIKKASESVTWEDVNFFQNEYFPNVGDVIFGKEKQPVTNYYSPDITTNGWLKKAWRRDENGIDRLFKLGSTPLYQEPFNEVFCSELLEKFKTLPHVTYSLGKIDNRICSVCENFATENKFFVPAFEVYQTAEKPTGEQPYNFLIKRCRIFGINKAREFIDAMITFDFLVHNTDRHMGNFGFMKNADTMEFAGIAPLFDNGTCLLGGETQAVARNEEAEKMFRSWQINQIQLIKNWDAIDMNDLMSMSDRLYELLKKANYDSERIDKICKEYDQRWKSLNKLKEKIQDRKKVKHISKGDEEIGD